MTYISDKLREEVRNRANFCCEYCLLSEEDSLYTHEVDHIIPIKHRGDTETDNLCLACLECNRYKGSNFASFDPETDEIVSLFHPRRHDWNMHFRLNEAYIVPLTSIGKVTVFVLQINAPHRLRARQALLNSEHYPPKDKP